MGPHVAAQVHVGTSWPAAATPLGRAVCRPPAPTRHSDYADTLASAVVQALIDEATLAPKPGLVDSRGAGAHHDLTLSLMQASAHALHPAFAAMAEAGLHSTQPDLALRETLGQLGRDAEHTMLATTGGINTHRGAIWALGLLVAAAAHLRAVPVTQAAPDEDTLISEQVAALAGTIARHEDRHRPDFTGNKGELARRAYGVGGARAQAQAGFPHVCTLALPELHRSRQRGDTENAARLNALLALMTSLDDTCVLSRAGPPGLALMQYGAAEVLLAGGVDSLAGRRHLRKLEAQLLAHRISPGGAADLLAATLFLDRLSPAPSRHD